MKTAMFQTATGIFVLLFLSSHAFANEPDFYINFSECKTLISLLKVGKEPLKLLDGDPLVSVCTKRSDKVSCQLLFGDGKTGYKGDMAEYRVTIDSPPLLHFQLIKGNEYVSIDTSQHVAILSSLVLDEGMMGSKVCHGIYMTGFEYKTLHGEKQ